MKIGRSARIWMILFLLFLTVAARAASLTVSMIDVGQGDSILVQFPNGKNMLVDAGTRNAGGTVVHYLKSRGIEKLDIAVATHPHEDHIGGMRTVLNAFPVGEFWDSGYVHGTLTQRNMLAAIEQKQIRFEVKRAGFTGNIGDVSISVLAPGRLLPGSANDNSIVLRVVYGGTSFLLAGDMEEEERRSITSWPRSTVLKVAHHGSRNGTDLRFLRQVSPRIAVISCGRGNSYGHPHRSVLDALKTVGADVFITARDGTVVLTSDGETVRARKLGARFSSEEK